MKYAKGMSLRYDEIAAFETLFRGTFLFGDFWGEEMFSFCGGIFGGFYIFVDGIFCVIYFFMMNMKRVVLIFALMVAVLPLAAQNGGSILGKYKKALIIGAHPDDPEYCCGGTALMLQRTGCEVVNVYLTGGEAGIPGKSGDDAKAIRQKEISDACAIMGVRSVQLSQVDGACEITKERYAEMKAVIEREKPDVVFTHWPIDSHRDHRICGILTYDAWRQLGHSFDLYYHEAMTGLQTQNFHPDTYVDITDVVETKHKACRAHASQEPDFILEWHIPMERFHGGEYQCKYAEAFVKQVWNPTTTQK